MSTSDSGRQRLRRTREGMRILMIGKYPPLEGGVSAHTYWLARSLGERGHEVAVVTNAERAEPENLLGFPRNDSVVRSQWVPRNVTYYSLKKSAPPHLPYSEAYVTRLANAAFRVLSEKGADVLYAHYLEPYATAGFFVKASTGIPLVVRHAGSDIFRLLKSDDCALALARVMRGADTLFLSKSLVALADELRIPRRRLATLPPPALHPAFTPEGDRAVLPDEGQCVGVPVIGYLGKAASLKGLLELLDAVAILRTEVRLVLVTDGPLLPELLERIHASEVLKRRVVRLPFVGPWEVPGLLRRFDMLVHLEHRFPIPIHSPLQPYEAIATETPLLLSEEMAQKLAFMMPEITQHATIVPDPRDAQNLCAVLETALADMNRLKRGAAALRAGFENDWNAHVDAYEKAFIAARRASVFRRILRIFSRFS